MSLWQLASELEDRVLLLLCAKDYLRLRSTCRVARDHFSKQLFLNSKTKRPGNRFAVFVLRFLAYRKVEKFLSDRTWWEYGADMRTETAIDDPELYRQVVQATRTIATYAFSAKLPRPNPLPILDYVTHDTSDVKRFDMNILCRVLYATEVRPPLNHALTFSSISLRNLHFCRGTLPAEHTSLHMLCCWCYECYRPISA